MDLDQDTQNLLWFLGIGLVAGFLAGKIMGGRGFGVVGNLLVGVLGALLGGYLVGMLGVDLGDGIAGKLLAALKTYPQTRCWAGLNGFHPRSFLLLPLG